MLQEFERVSWQQIAGRVCDREKTQGICVTRRSLFLRLPDETCVRLEVYLRCQLRLTTSGCGGDQAKVAGGEVCGWIQELRVVEDASLPD
jgi:hypothetical protein